MDIAPLDCYALACYSNNSTGAHACVRLRPHECLCVCVCMYVFVCLCVCMYVCECVCVCTCVCVSTTFPPHPLDLAWLSSGMPTTADNGQAPNGLQPRAV